MKPKSPKQTPPEPVEWDLSESFGVLPEGLSLTHNLGCARTPKSKKDINPSQLEDSSPKK
jgi:hypothetical protein